MSCDGVGRFVSWLDSHAVGCYGHLKLRGLVLNFVLVGLSSRFAASRANQVQEQKGGQASSRPATITAVLPVCNRHHKALSTR